MDLLGSHEEKKGHKNIKCNVCNCVYHRDNNHCGASKIAVGPSYAASTTDTVCATFEQKNI